MALKLFVGYNGGTMEIMQLLYKKVLKPVLFTMDAEFVHDAFINTGVICGKTGTGKKLIASWYSYHGKPIGKIVDGIKYRIPVLLAAGFDYNGRLTNILGDMAFGGEEIGSVTARPCPGNEKPRLLRAIKSQSIIVYKGLRNAGVEKLITTLKQAEHPEDFILGISIARTNDARAASLDDGIADYLYSLKRLIEEDLGQYYTLNISCPNAFGGETFAKKERLELLLKAVKTVKTKKPVYVKMPLNLAEDEFIGLVQLVEKYELNGVVIGNLNKHYQDLDFPGEAPGKYRGGLSGKPCRKLSDQLIALTRKHFPKMTIIGVGGILTPEDALDKFHAGADLVQLITGMIFTGPHLMKKIAVKLQ
jgi:dihydroorotate dehydrogenase subfamily 2